MKKFKPRHPDCPPLRIWDEAKDLPSVAARLNEHMKECLDCRNLDVALKKLPPSAPERFDVKAYLEETKEISDGALKLIEYFDALPELPDDCPSYQVWIDAYGTRPNDLLREYLEKHIATCSICHERDPWQKQMVEDLLKS